MNYENPYGAAVIEEEVLAQDFEDTKYQRIGGWLILVAFGLIFTAAGSLFVLAFTYFPIFYGRTFTSLTTPGSLSYHAMWGPVLIFEVVGNAALGLFAAVVLIFMFCRSRRFPDLMLAYLVLRLLFVLTDQALATQIPAVVKQWATQGSQELIRAVVYTGVWTPYILRSVRVKKTFVN